VVLDLSFPQPRRDPFDRMPAAQAEIERLVLLTDDPMNITDRMNTADPMNIADRDAYQA
jgi:PIN domain nuclease of toxin-antitoxin system